MTLGTTILGTTTLGIMVIRDSIVTILDTTDTMVIMDILVSMTRSMDICIHTTAAGTADGGHITIVEDTTEVDITSHLMEAATDHQKGRPYIAARVQRHSPRTE